MSSDGFASERQARLQSILQLDLDVIADTLQGADEMGYAYGEYTRQVGDDHYIEPGEYIDPIVEMLGWPVRDRDQEGAEVDFQVIGLPWATALFCWRVKTHLESEKCTGLIWRPVDFYNLSDATQVFARIDDRRRYLFILGILAKCLDPKGLKAKRRFRVTLGERRPSM